MSERTIPAEHFAATMDVNVNNNNLSDSEFRSMVRKTLPAVIYHRPITQERILEARKAYFAGSRTQRLGQYLWNELLSGSPNGDLIFYEENNDKALERFIERFQVEHKTTTEDS